MLLQVLVHAHRQLTSMEKGAAAQSVEIPSRTEAGTQRLKGVFFAAGELDLRSQQHVTRKVCLATEHPPGRTHKDSRPFGASEFQSFGGCGHLVQKTASSSS